MEWFDVCDEGGRPTGERISREEAHRLGVRHRTAHVWILRKTGQGTEVLLQKRSEKKDSYPGCYDTSSAGHIEAGDEPLPSALRELSEELGIRAEEKDLRPIGTFSKEYREHFHGAPFHDNEVAFVYVLQREIDADTLTLQEDEVSDVTWFFLAEVMEACRARDPRFCVPVESLELLRQNGFLEENR